MQMTFYFVVPMRLTSTREMDCKNVFSTSLVLDPKWEKSHKTPPKNVKYIFHDFQNEVITKNLWRYSKCWTFHNNDRSEDKNRKEVQGLAKTCIFKEIISAPIISAHRWWYFLAISPRVFKFLLPSHFSR